MTNLTTLDCLANAVSKFFMPKLLASEDFDSFESNISEQIRKIGAQCLKSCLESFDKILREHLPRGWTLHDMRKRTLITLLGAVTYKRSVYIDTFGNQRIWLDEILGIPKRTRLSTGAFLWVVRNAAQFSYRKTASEFGKLTGEAISHVCVMNCVHAEGRLLKNEQATSSGPKISQETIFTEVDGLWIHLQNERHRKHALPRFCYEQARKTLSFELKMACIYAGKNRVGPGRYERGNLKVIVGDDSPEEFWDSVVSQIKADYDIDDLKHIWLGHDGAQWCGTEKLAQSFGDNKVIGSLDPFHVMKYITKAFPEGATRENAVHLAYSARGEQLAEMSNRIAEEMEDGSAKQKVKDLAQYVKNHVADVRFPVTSMGTMEATNYHVGAARCKNNATSWSRRGAEAMCLIRAALQTGRSLISPDKGIFFSEKEKERKQTMLSRVASGSIPVVVGSGYEMPFSHVAIPKNVAISVARRT